MKKGLLRKVMAYLVVLAFVLAFMPSGIDRVYAAEKKINAVDYAGKDINTDNLDGFEKGDTLIIEVEDEVSMGDIYVDGNMILTGTGVLNAGELYISGDVTFESGTTFSCSSLSDSDPLHCENSIKIESGAKVSSAVYGSFNSRAVFAKKSIDIAGDLSINSSGYGLCVYENGDGKLSISGGTIDIYCASFGIYSDDIIDISGGDIAVDVLHTGIKSGKSIDISGGKINILSDEYGITSYDLSISGGTVDVDSNNYDCIYMYDLFEMTGGEVTLNTDVWAFYANDINITGGKLVSECALKNEAQKDNFVVNNSINIGDGMYIEEPEGGKFSKVENDDDDEKELVTKSYEYNHITDANDEVPNKIVIASISEPEPTPDPTPTPEPTPTPDPDDKGDSDKGDSDKGDSDKKDEKKYSNEWVDGKWYDANGKCTYDGILSWKQSDSGWWVEDTKGWYPTSTWQKIDGKWYYFCADGYMDYSEYRDGYWLGDDGAWVEDYYGGHWMSDSTGWWYEDASGWYPVSRWLWIDGSCYYFEASGYMATSKYVDGCWVGADGAWVK
ncbi:MAG: carbohydrate-binding domain-containing protein [Eubacterium sp.]|nr:carbohydrate-binding domain-containing protein [Eubacterium sp.]